MFIENFVLELPVPESDHDLIVLAHLLVYMLITDITDNFLRVFTEILLLLQVQKELNQKRPHTKGLVNVAWENRPE